MMQPFDSGKFDKRYDDVYRPAIESAGLEAYRVDRDPAVDVPIDAIEEGIRNATVCLADISTDNANVWFELGFAFAAGKQVVMVCSKERPDKKYPFDIQHRSIIPYAADSPSDFDALKVSIRDRIKAMLNKGATLRQIEQQEQVSPVEGLTQPELYVLAEIAGGVFMPHTGVAAFTVKSQLQTVLTSFGFSLGLRRLVSRDFVRVAPETDRDGDEYESLFLTDKAWGWIEAHEGLFVIRRPSAKSTSRIVSDDDDIPY
ncbi:MAG: hypothetical protein U0Q16_28120 [Bryobacteraceae bacterium]